MGAVAMTWEQVWQDKRYIRLHARKDALGHRWNQADAVKHPDAAKLKAAFSRACKRINAFEKSVGL